MTKKVVLTTLALIFCVACSSRGSNSNNNNNSNSNNNNSNSNNNNTPVGWTLVGSANISSTESEEPIIRFYNNVPYVAFIDVGNTSKVRVMKYVSGAWTNVGGSGFSENSSNLSFEIGSTGNLYVGYSDGDSAGNLTVMAFDGTSWNVLGSAGFSTGIVEHTSMALNATNLYIAYYDQTEDAVKVQTYSGGVWTELADAYTGEASHISITASDTGLYIANIDAVTNLITIGEYNGLTWDSIGPGGPNEYKSINISLKGTLLYLACVRTTGGEKALGAFYDTDTAGPWTGLGGVTGVILTGAVENLSMYVHSNGISNDVVYIAYRDPALSDKATVKMIINNSLPTDIWATIGDEGFTPDSITQISINVGGGHPYVAYRNNNTLGIDVRKY